MDTARALSLLLTVWLLAGCSTTKQPLVVEQDPQAVALAGALEAELLTAERAEVVTARLRIATRDPSQARRAPVNLALVIDASGSMRGEAIEDARAACKTMVDALTTGDRLAIVAFGSAPEVLFPSTTIDDAGRTEAKRKLDAMKAEGTTDLAGGLALGIDQVAQHLSQDGVNRVVLLGDGVPNDEAAVHATTARAAELSISITALGLGLEHDEALMGTIAQATGGRFRHIGESAAVAEIFQQEVLRLRSVYARNATVQLTPGPGVQIVEVIGQQPSQNGRSHTVTVGDVSRDETRDLYVRLAVSGHRSGASVELLDAVLSFDDGIGGAGRIERRLFLGAQSSDDEAAVSAARSPSLAREVALIRAAATVVRAHELSRAGQRETARAELELAAAELDKLAATGEEGDALRDKAKELRALRDDLPEAAVPVVAPSAAPAKSPRTKDAIERQMESYAAARENF